MTIHPIAQRRRKIGDGAQVGNVVRTALADDPAGHAVGERGDILPGFLRPRAAPSRHPHHLVVADRVNAEFLAAEETLARVEDGLEHRRRIGDGFADRAEHFGRGLLLLQSLLRSLNSRAFSIAITA